MATRRLFFLGFNPKKRGLAKHFVEAQIEKNNKLIDKGLMSLFENDETTE